MERFIVIWTIVLLIMLTGVHLLLAYKTNITLVIGLFMLIIGTILTAAVLIYRKEIQDSSNSSS